MVLLPHFGFAKYLTVWITACITIPLTESISIFGEIAVPRKTKHFAAAYLRYYTKNNSRKP